VFRCSARRRKPVRVTLKLNGKALETMRAECGGGACHRRAHTLYELIDQQSPKETLLKSDGAGLRLMRSRSARAARSKKPNLAQ